MPTKTHQLTAETDENSIPFHQGMINRMDLSFFKYGRFHANYQGLLDAAYIKDLRDTLSAFANRWHGKVTSTANCNAIGFVLQRLLKYLSTANTEWLMDSANGLMIESVCPQVTNAHFRATDSDESPGVVGMSENEMKAVA